MDIVRETLFNWLCHDIQNAHCLDLFAGTGSLGFEALSRGAKHVVFVDRQSGVLSALKENAKQLCTPMFPMDQHILICFGDFPHRMPSLQGPFQLVFLDPPFQQSQHIAQSAHCLVKHQLLAEHALIYIESQKPISSDDLPHAWSCYRHKRYGATYMSLYAS